MKSDNLRMIGREESAAVSRLLSCLDPLRLEAFRLVNERLDNRLAEPIPLLRQAGHGAAADAVMSEPVEQRILSSVAGMERPKARALATPR